MSTRAICERCGANLENCSDSSALSRLGIGVATLARAWDSHREGDGSYPQIKD